MQGVLMSILTGRELEFLAGLRTDWRRLYLTEVECLLKEDDSCDGKPEVPSIVPLPFTHRHAVLQNGRMAESAKTAITCQTQGAMR
jgi:hypothetical protein